MNAKRLAAALSTSHREKDLTNAKVRDIRQKALNFLADVRVPLGRTVIRSDAGSLRFANLSRFSVSCRVLLVA